MANVYKYILLFHSILILQICAPEIIFFHKMWLATLRMDLFVFVSAGITGTKACLLVQALLALQHVCVCMHYWLYSMFVSARITCTTACLCVHALLALQHVCVCTHYWYYSMFVCASITGTTACLCVHALLALQHVCVCTHYWHYSMFQ
jgi:hypothetical protein